MKKGYVTILICIFASIGQLGGVKKNKGSVNIYCIHKKGDKTRMIMAIQEKCIALHFKDLQTGASSYELFNKKSKVLRCGEDAKNKYCALLREYGNQKSIFFKN